MTHGILGFGILGALFSCSFVAWATGSFWLAALAYVAGGMLVLGTVLLLDILATRPVEDDADGSRVLPEQTPA